MECIVNIIIQWNFLWRFLSVRKKCIEKRNADGVKIIRINYFDPLALGGRIFILRGYHLCFQSPHLLLEFRNQQLQLLIDRNDYYRDYLHDLLPTQNE